LPFIIYLDLSPFIPGPIENIRHVKEIFSYIIISLFVIISIHNGLVIKNPCKILSVLIFYLMINWLIAPQYSIKVLGENVAGFWIFRTLVDVLLCYFMVMSIASLTITKNTLMLIFEGFCYVALISSIYVFIQYFRLDQWQNIIDTQSVRSQTNPGLTSFYGQTNFVASFIALLMPFIICRKKWIILFISCVALMLIDSKMGIIMACSVFIIYGIMRSCNGLKLLIFLISGCLLPIIFEYRMNIWNLILNECSGRITAWQTIIKEIINPSFTNNSFMITGYGLGSYEFIFKHLEPNQFSELHNEWLEFIVHAGIIGEILLITCIVWILKNLYPIIIKDKYMFAMTCSFLVICIGNTGLFLWQIEPHRFYTLFMLGVFFNRLTKGEDNVQKDCSGCASIDGNL